MLRRLSLRSNYEVGCDGTILNTDSERHMSAYPAMAIVHLWRRTSDTRRISGEPYDKEQQGRESSAQEIDSSMHRATFGSCSSASVAPLTW